MSNDTGTIEVVELTDKQAVDHLPISLSALRHDRCRCAKGYKRFNVPFHYSGGNIVYLKHELEEWKQKRYGLKRG